MAATETTFNFAKEEAWGLIETNMTDSPALKGLNQQEWITRARAILDELWENPPNFSEAIEGLSAVPGKEDLFKCLSYQYAEMDYQITRNVARICVNAVVMVVNAEIEAHER